MGALRPFEIEVVRRLGVGALSADQMASIQALQHHSAYEYTGSGYYLTVAHDSLPAEPRTLSRPHVAGKVGEIQCGFVLFLGKGELVLECHTWGPVDVPEHFRDMSVELFSPSVAIHDAT